MTPYSSFSRTVLFDLLTVDTNQRCNNWRIATEACRSSSPTDFAWRPVDRQELDRGSSSSSSGLVVQFGQLILDHGAWHDDQVVPENWVHEATSAQVEVDDRTSYGSLWWRTTLADTTPLPPWGTAVSR